MKKLLALFTFALVLTFWGCSDKTANPVSQDLQGKSNLKIYLVDSPSSLDSLIIFVKRVEVHKSGSDSTSGWSVINNNLRRFDLLQLRNGASAVLGDTVLEPGQYSQIRLILSDGNYAVNQGTQYKLTVPSGFQTGIKLNHEFTLEPNNLYELVLDFNVDKSVHVTGNGKYMMKPVIRVTPQITSGTISGQVLPLDAQATVFTTIGTDTVSTYPDSNGFFKLMTLPYGLYNVTIFPDTSKYRDSTIVGVNVLANQNTDLGVIELKNK
jgi:hypothetical protein